VDIDLGQLPIPDWGLVCPKCSYPLQGLPSHRCPECGQSLDIAELVQSWTRLREPRFTGRELPLPDFGLNCAACGRPLAGAREHRCPACQAGFDWSALRPPKEWFVLGAESCGDLPIPGVQALLAAELVPHFPVTEKTVGEVYGGQSMTVGRLRVASEFYFEVLWLLQQARAEMRAARAAGWHRRWRCPGCGELNPGHFEICWNCQNERKEP
jgi:hypothetical protein